MKKIWYINYSKTSSFFARFNPAIHYSFFHRNPNITTFGTVYGVTENQNFNVGFVNGLIDVNYLENNITGSGRLTLMNNQGNRTSINMNQLTIASMPFLLRSGLVVKNSNNNVALDFNGGNYWLQSDNYSFANTILDKNSTMFVVFRSQAAATAEAVTVENQINNLNRIGIFSDTGSNRFHTLYLPQNTLPLGLFFSTQQSQSTNRILSFRRSDNLTNLIEAFDKDLNLIDSKINAIKYLTSTDLFYLLLGRQNAGSFFNSLWLETIIFDRSLSNSEMLEINNILKSDYGIS